MVEADQCPGQAQAIAETSGAHTIPLRNGELQNLQILRAVAATSVVYWHIGSFPRFGFFGVDVFFVLSGFVMAMVVANGQNPRNFVMSRATRIVPLYWLLTTCRFSLSALTPALLNSPAANLSEYIKSLLFIPYFKGNGGFQPVLSVGWTLNYEMFFYLCMALAMFASRKRYILLTSGFIFVSYVCFGKLLHSDVANTFFGRAIVFEFLLGMFAFRIWQQKYLMRLPKQLLIATGLLAFVFMATVQSMEVGADRFILYGIPSVFLVLSAVCLEGQLSSVSHQMIRRLASIGDASYATYLSHLYVVEGFKRVLLSRFKLIDPHGLLGVLLILAASLCVGQIIYKFIDNPLRILLKRQLRSQPVAF
jgi:peptidoglycan/LPS O-acetylase OafA/YrhL